MAQKPPDPADYHFTPTGRLAAGLLTRHWATFAIELVLIVIGILIALSIDGWAQEREDRRAERAYLGVLSRDLEQMIEGLQAYYDFESSVTESAKVVLKTLSEDSYEQRVDELNAHLSSMAARRTLRLVSAAYTDLTSTGSLRLINSRSLRDRLLRYFAEVSRIERVIEKNNTVFVDQQYFPFLQQMGISWLSAASLRLDPTLNDTESEVAGFLLSGIRLPADDVLRRPPEADSWDDIRRMVIMRMRISSIGETLARSLIAETRTLNAAIEQELAGR
jgi:type II secretory pathway pseudopilin PulG